MSWRDCTGGFLQIPLSLSSSQALCTTVDIYRNLNYTILVTTIIRTDTFAAWFKGLRDRAAAARIAIHIDRLAWGNPGKHRNLTSGVREMKVDFGPGYRVYFTERSGEIVILLCGGDKKSQDSDIATAIRMVSKLE